MSRASAIALLPVLLLVACATRSASPRDEVSRFVALSGTLNTRDLGGYETSDGRRVRWGRLYRSDELSRLASKDVARLSGIGLRTVLDLRTDFEREGKADRLPDATQSEHLPISHPSMDPQYLTNRILKGDVEADYFQRLLTRANRTFALEHGPEMAAVVRGLAEPDALPALFHCTYGKDRTGFVAAMILDILGVPWEVIVEDYLLSNATLESRINRTAWLIWFASRFNISRTSARHLLGVDRTYLESARDAIIEEYGSTGEYFRAIGLEETTLERLREALLEPDAPDG